MNTVPQSFSQPKQQEVLWQSQRVNLNLNRVSVAEFITKGRATAFFILGGKHVVGRRNNIQSSELGDSSLPTLRKCFQGRPILHRAMSGVSSVCCCRWKGCTRLEFDGSERSILDYQPWDFGDVDEFQRALAEGMGEE